MSGPAALPIDGRLARSERSRRAVVDALLDLLEAGDPRPTAARIAERAGVSLRSVFQHFDNLEVLYATAADRQIERLGPLLRPIERGGPFAERLQTFVARRSRLLEAMAPVRRASVREEWRSAELASRLTRVRAAGRAEVAVVFAPELARIGAADRADVESALAVAASWSAWEELRSHQGLAPARARRVLALALSRLLGVAVDAADRGRRPVGPGDVRSRGGGRKG
jgi:TetR/AcrR family transcriptional regulator, regulator of autoinduction and epiphytic fitness